MFAENKPHTLRVQLGSAPLKHPCTETLRCSKSELQILPVSESVDEKVIFYFDFLFLWEAFSFAFE